MICGAQAMYLAMLGRVQQNRISESKCFCIPAHSITAMQHACILDITLIQHYALVLLPLPVASSSTSGQSDMVMLSSPSILEQKLKYET